MSPIPIPGSEYLGRPYDIFGEYASDRSFGKDLFRWGPKQPLQLGGRTYLVPVSMADDPLQITQPGLHFTRSASGKNAQEYHRDFYFNFEAEASYLAFSGSVSTRFREKVEEQTYHAFVTVYELVHTYTLRLPDADWRTFLRPGAREAIEEMDPSRLFQEYGTHYVISLVGGGKLEANTAVDMRRYGHNTDIKAAASFAFDALVASGKASMETGISRAVKSFYELSEKTATAIGGNPALQAKAQDFEQVAEWRASVEQYPKFVDFEGPESFRPIWELCADFDDTALDWSPVRRRPHFMGRRQFSARELPPARVKPRWRQLYEAFLDYAAAGQETGFDASEPPEVITDILVEWGDDYKDASTKLRNRQRQDPDLHVCVIPQLVQNPVTHEIVEIDVPANLNSGTDKEGLTIFLLYRKEPMFSSSGSMVINGVDVEDVGHNVTRADDPGDGWEWLTFDLNEGAGGAYLFLKYSDQAIEKTPTGDVRASPLVDLLVRFTDVEFAPKVEHYTAIEPELNKGAGGKYIWLLKKHL